MKLWKTILIPTLSLFVICLVVAGALAGSNAITARKIEELNRRNTEALMKQVLPAEAYEEVSAEGGTVYRASSGGAAAGYVIVTAAKGYGGDVQVMTGFDETGAITNIDIVACDDETPGLGQRVKERAFLDQFVGKAEKTVLKTDVDAITGATISSTAVNQAVNDARSIWEQIEGGE